ncbi:CynX/NimT family MFS transporter [Cohnella sp. AR92]|uniref:MFS transporter n=1 Tax=Cohnella sp. AR92 TaxID=648716 RepID=UPI000F8CB7A2|nr:MFS transporter [Cohnella sp. AR92]RUS42866.1 MFS transporter [Cohnella sp. AR92]
MIAALFMASLNLRPAISSISPVLEGIRSDLGMNAFLASLLTAIPVLCMGCLSPLSVRLSRLMGMERSIAWSLVLIGGGTLLRLFASSTALLLLTALLTGVGVAIMGPLLSGFIKKHFARSTPLMIALYAMALSLGATLGASLSAPLDTAWHSWQSALAFWAVLALAAIPVWGRAARESSHASPEEGTERSPESKMPWTNKKAWLLTVHFGFMALVFYSLLGWLPPIMESEGFSNLEAGMLLTLFSAVQIPSGMVLQMLLGRYPSRLFWLLASSSLQLIGLVLLLYAALPWLAAPLCGFSSGMLFALGTMLPIEAASNPREAASWAAMTQSVGYLIAALGPLLVGWINDATHEFRLAIFGLIGVTLGLMFIQWRIWPRRPKAIFGTSL